MLLNVPNVEGEEDDRTRGYVLLLYVKKKLVMPGNNPASFVFLLITSIVFALFSLLLLLSLSRRSSGAGSPSRLSSPLPTMAHAFIFYRDKTPALFSPRRLTSSCSSAEHIKGINTTSNAMAYRGWRSV